MRPALIVLVIILAFMAAFTIGGAIASLKVHGSLNVPELITAAIAIVVLVASIFAIKDLTTT